MYSLFQNPLKNPRGKRRGKKSKSRKGARRRRNPSSIFGAALANPRGRAAKKGAAKRGAAKKGAAKRGAAKKRAKPGKIQHCNSLVRRFAKAEIQRNKLQSAWDKGCAMPQHEGEAPMYGPEVDRPRGRIGTYANPRGGRKAKKSGSRKRKGGARRMYAIPSRRRGGTNAGFSRRRAAKRGRARKNPVVANPRSKMGAKVSRIASQVRKLGNRVGKVERAVKQNKQAILKRLGEALKRPQLGR